MKKAFLVDDLVILLNGLVSILKEHDQFEVVGTAPSVENALLFPRSNQPDVLITATTYRTMMASPLSEKSSGVILT